MMARPGTSLFVLPAAPTFAAEIDDRTRRPVRATEIAFAKNRILASWQKKPAE